MHTIKQLFCDYRIGPSGIEGGHPRFSWSCETSQENPTGFRLLVASAPEILQRDIGDLWDTGDVLTGENHIRYGGRPLQEGATYWWKVRLLDNKEERTPWKEDRFATAIGEDRWKAKWISPKRIEPNHLPEQPDPAPLLRRSFSVTDQVDSARLFICGLGYYRVYLNGERIGDYALAPEVAQYDRTVYYDSYDVETLSKGENVLAVELGNGWYNCFTKDAWNFCDAPWRHFPKLLAQLEITYHDGTKAVIHTDGSWKWTEGPTLFDGLRNGETYDSRKEIPGWNARGFDDSAWKPVMVTRPPGGTLRANPMPQVRIAETIVPRLSLSEKDHKVFDMGRCMSGYARIRLTDVEANRTLTLHYGEKIDAEGHVDTSDIEYLITSGSFQTDRYSTSGKAEEVWAPQFTYHGFRYVEVSGYDGPMEVVGLDIHTDMERRGKLATSNPTIDAIHAMCVRSVLVNYHSIPTDCPHREKNGWTGDAHLSSDQLLQNLDGVASYRKFLYDIIDCQRPDGAIPGIVPTPN